MPTRPPPPLILPKTLDPIAYIVGLDNAMRLARAVGPHPGSRPSLYIPRQAEESHFLTRILGAESASRLCQEMGGAHWYPPQGEGIESAVLARQVLDLLELGYDSMAIADRTGTDQRWVNYIRKAYQAWEETGDLEEACRRGKMSKVYLSLMLNRGW